MSGQPRTAVDRIGRLERQVRVQRAVLCVLALFAAAALLVGARKSKQYSGEAFILRDKNGNARAKLYVSEDGPRLAMTDRRARPRLVLGLLNETEPHLALADDAGAVRARLSLENHLPYLVMRDRDKKDRLHLALDETGAAHLDYMNADRAALVRLTCFRHEPRLDLGAPGKPHALLGIRDGVPTVELQDEDGETVFSKP